MDSIRSQRVRLNDGNYNLALDIQDSAYFNVYENADQKSGEDFLREYLNSSADDASYEDVEVKYNKGSHTVKITAKLNYDSHEHKDYPNRNRLM